MLKNTVKHKISFVLPSTTDSKRFIETPTIPQ